MIYCGHRGAKRMQKRCTEVPKLQLFVCLLLSFLDPVRHLLPYYIIAHKNLHNVPPNSSLKHLKMVAKRQGVVQVCINWHETFALACVLVKTTLLVRSTIHGTFSTLVDDTAHLFLHKHARVHVVSFNPVQHSSYTFVSSAHMPPSLFAYLQYSTLLRIPLNR
jgi:hypothetical protein